MLKKILFSCIISSIPLMLIANVNKIVESQPQILFEYEALLTAQEKRELLVQFNTGVLYLEKGRYQEAIQLFKQSSKILKIASFLKN